MSVVSVEPVGIERNTTYPLVDFMRLSRMGVHAMRTARRRGLKVTYTSRRGYVSGSDFLDWLTTQGAATPKSEASPAR